MRSTTTSSPALHLCPLCEGRGKTGRLVRGESGQTFHGLPVLLCIDRPCGVCGGTGEVGAATFARWTAPARKAHAGRE